MTDDGSGGYVDDSGEARKKFEELMEENGVVLSGKVRSNPENPSAVAEEFVAEWNDERVHWRDEFYHWNGSYWERENWGDLQATLNHELKSSRFVMYTKEKPEGREMPWSPNNSRLSNLEKQLRLQAHRRWDEEGESSGDFIYLDGGTWVRVTGEVMPSDKSRFNLHASPVAYDKGATCPQYLRFLNQMFEDDEASVETHLLWQAYELTGSNALQKAYMLVGQKRTGKGTSMDLQTALLGGQRSVAATSLAAFENGFGYQGMIGKTVCRIQDARDAGGKAMSAAAQGILSITGGGLIRADIKGKQAWEGRLGVRFTIDTNEMIHFPDASGTVASRFIYNLTNTQHSWLGHEDTGLPGRLMGELPGILNLLLDRMEAIWEKWPVSERVSDMMNDAEESASPIIAWARDVGMVFGFEELVSRDDARDSYDAWRQMEGLHRVDSRIFGRDLSAAFPMLGKYYSKPSDGPRQRHYRGMGFPK